MADLVQRILDLRKRVDQAADLRSKATTALEVAKQRLADVDARLKEHGINPEQCEPELKALEQSLDQHVTEFDAKLTDEIAAYNRIIAAAQAADAGERVMIGDADVARVVHEAIRAFCLVTEARELPSWDKASDSDRDSTVQAVQFTREHPEADPESEHERWCNEKIAAGWRYDAVRDNAKKHHPALMPYAQLSVIQRQKDALIQAIVRALGE